MALHGLIRWTAYNCSSVCCRRSGSVYGQVIRCRSFSSGQRAKFGLNVSCGTELGRSLFWRTNGMGNIMKNGWYSTAANDDDKDPSPAPSAEGQNDICDFDAEEQCTLYLSDEELDTLTDGDPELIKKVRHIQLEHEIFRQEGMQVPPEPISLRRWEELLSKTSVSQRKKYYIFLFKLWHIKRNELMRREIKKKEREEFLKTQPPLPPLGEDEHGTIYGLNRNTLYLRLRESTEYHFYNNRLLQAAKFGPPIVFDCGFDHCMNQKENKYCSAQIELAFASNRLHPSPMDLHLCNLQPDTFLEKYLVRRMPFDDPTSLLSVTTDSYLDLFPKERIVYLTPHTRDDLEKFNEDDIYIIGALVDTRDNRPYSMAKAKKEGLRMKRLPIDKYLQWGHGGKSLTLDQMMRIMLDIRHYKNWNIAFKHVPKRKLFRAYEDDEDMEEDNYADEAAPKARIYPPTYVTRTGPKTIMLDDDGEDLRRAHNQNRVNVIEAPLPTDEYHKPERALYDQNSNFSRYNRTNDYESYQRPIRNSSERHSAFSAHRQEENKNRGFNVSGFSNPKGNSNKGKSAKVNLSQILKDNS